MNYSLPKPAPQEFKLLTVAETNGLSDRLIAEQNSYVGCTRWTLRICVELNRTVTLDCSKDGHRTVSLSFPRTNIPSLIQFLQDAQTFISEEEMIETLAGRR